MQASSELRAAPRDFLLNKATTVLACYLLLAQKTKAHEFTGQSSTVVVFDYG